MSDLLSRVNITGFDAAGYINTHRNNVSALPNIGIAASGGGYRAMLNGAGALAAFDSRTDNANTTGHLGGLLQSATYLAGLSGGSWLVGSLYGNNNTAVQDIMNGRDNQLWDLTNSILKGPDGSSIQLLDTANYYRHLYDQVQGKSAVFNTTLTDYWGRALSYQLINAADGGPDYTWSSIAQQDFFTSASVPMPIIIADGRAPGEINIADNTTIFEFNPWEFGTWDRTVYAFAPMEYVGTNFSNGAVVDTQRCVTGYDNIGYVYGTSSTLFNQIVLQFNTTVSLPDFLETGIQAALNHFGESDNDIASYVNPFVGVHPATNLGVDSPELTLVDGGEDGENVPLHPLIQPFRNVDVIFAIDSSAGKPYTPRIFEFALIS
jgi:lysophospholipase